MMQPIGIDATGNIVMAHYPLTQWVGEVALEQQSLSEWRIEFGGESRVIRAVVRDGQAILEVGAIEPDDE